MICLWLSIISLKNVLIFTTNPTRQVNDLTLSLNKKSFSDHAIGTSGPHLWNSLPDKLKDSKTVKQFRNQLKQTLIETYE